MKKLCFLMLFMLLSGSLYAQDTIVVYFDFDSSEPNDISNVKLSEWIKSNPTVEVQKIYGYADKTGDSLYNIDLSERRAQYVFKQFSAANLKSGDVEIKSFGESRSNAPDNLKDRKVEVYYKKPPVSELRRQISKAGKGDKVVLKNLNFYTNSPEILPAAKPLLKELLNILKDYPSINIQIQGHVCCQVENEERLSYRRALAVYNYLIENGIDQNRLSHTGFGSTMPIYPLPEKNEQERIANRRVEIEILAK